VTILPGSTFGLSDTHPVGSFVAGSFKEITLNKGLYQMDWMGVFIYPIKLDAAHDAAQDMAGKMGNAYLG